MFIDSQSGSKAFSKWVDILSIVGLVGVAVYILIETAIRRARHLDQAISIFQNFLSGAILANLAGGIFLVVIAIVCLWARRKYPSLQRGLNLAARSIGVFLLFWLIYQGTAYFIDYKWWTPLKSYFPDLAAAFLQGKTYLDAPKAFVDLTMFQNKWYVSFPPLASLLMLPQVALSGSDSVNTIHFTILFGAASVAIVFAILESLSRQGWTKLNLWGNVWLTILFGLGTMYWSMVVAGQVWYISQILTVAFAALAVLLAINIDSPLPAGLSLAIGMLARPNIALLWPFLFGIFWQRKISEGTKLTWKQALTWMLLSIIPAVIVALVVRLKSNVT